MAHSVSFHLEGPSITIDYGNGELRVDGDDHLLQQTFGSDSADRLRTETSDIGTVITAVLLPSSRNGTKITLILLVPQVEFGAGVTSADVTGVAIVTKQFRDVISAAPDVLQEYETRELRGTAAVVDAASV